MSRISTLACICALGMCASCAGPRGSARSASAETEFLGIFTQTTGVRDLDIEYDEIKAILEQNPYISGIAIRARWSQLNPAEDEFDFSRLDRLIALIAEHEQLVILKVFPGAGTPMWVYEKGTPRFSEISQSKGFFAYGQEQNCPVPWDPHYMAAWERMLSEVAKRYDEDPRIFAVGMYGHNYKEVEMYMPNSADNMRRWKEEFGWTPERVEQNWKRWIDLYGETFKRLEFDMVLSELYRDPETNKVRDELIRYAAEKYPGRMIAEHHGLHGGVDQNENPNVGAIRKAGPTVRGGVEFVASYYDNPESNRWEVGSIEMNILNAKYVPNLAIIHIWERDAFNPGFSKLLLDTYDEYKDMTAEEMRAHLQANGLYLQQ